MKRAVIIIIFLAILGAVLLGLFWKRPPSNAITLFGNVDVRQVNIGFRVAGEVAALYFEEGDLVSKGNLMAILDKSPYDNQVSQAKANAESIKTNLENAELVFNRRMKAIHVGGVTDEDLDNARASRDQTFANLRAAEAAVAVASNNLEYTEAYAPTDGIILSRVREPGTVVNPADPVYILSVTSPVWIRAFVAEPQLGLINFGMDAEVFTDSGQVYRGKIGFISPVAEFTPKTVETTQLRTDLVYRLRIYVDNPDAYLKQGMPVTVTLHPTAPSE